MIWRVPPSFLSSFHQSTLYICTDNRKHHPATLPNSAKNHQPILIAKIHFSIGTVLEMCSDCAGRERMWVTCYGSCARSSLLPVVGFRVPIQLSSSSANKSQPERHGSTFIGLTLSPTVAQTTRRRLVSSKTSTGSTRVY
ncbi:hypothetical protein EmuJ_000357000 [Echinococcus multilocularis]|uniref:Uncharacterized protein n=1 Tax=Echinococcus multilocularis TaxID=6211 RepID=A0A068XW73_ECHMU|nr:hypothetical protein EmuJ_000357000 [Echinococcus multilocularis]